VKSGPSRVVCPRATPIGIGYPDRAAQDGEPVPNLADSLQQRPTQETAGRLWIQTVDSGNSDCEPADSGSFSDTHQAAWKAPPACPPSRDRLASDDCHAAARFTLRAVKGAIGGFEFPELAGPAAPRRLAGGVQEQSLGGRDLLGLEGRRISSPGRVCEAGGMTQGFCVSPGGAAEAGCMFPPALRA
jgi:hypothetical protein